jgi:hypothetical protein
MAMDQENMCSSSSSSSSSSVDGDDDYEEPGWGQGGGQVEEETYGHSAADMANETVDEMVVAECENRTKLMAERRKKTRDALATYEPLYIVERERPVSEGWGGLQQFMSGNPQPSNFIDLCQELSAVEREMGTCIDWVIYQSEFLAGVDVDNVLRDLLGRCRAVKTSVEYRRNMIMSISNFIAYTYKDCHVDYIVDERFSVLTPLVVPVAAPPFTGQSNVPWFICSPCAEGAEAG